MSDKNEITLNGCTLPLANVVAAFTADPDRMAFNVDGGDKPERLTGKPALLAWAKTTPHDSSDVFTHLGPILTSQEMTSVFDAQKVLTQKMIEDAKKQGAKKGGKINWGIGKTGKIYRSGGAIRCASVKGHLTLPQQALSQGATPEFYKWLMTGMAEDNIVITTDTRTYERTKKGDDGKSIKILDAAGNHAVDPTTKRKLYEMENVLDTVYFAGEFGDDKRGIELGTSYKTEDEARADALAHLLLVKSIAEAMEAAEISLERFHAEHKKDKK